MSEQKQLTWREEIESTLHLWELQTVSDKRRGMIAKKGNQTNKATCEETILRSKRHRRDAGAANRWRDAEQVRNLCNVQLTGQEWKWEESEHAEKLGKVKPEDSELEGRSEKKADCAIYGARVRNLPMFLDVSGTLFLADLVSGVSVDWWPTFGPTGSKL